MRRVIVVVLNYRTPELSVQAAVSAAQALEGFGGAIVLVDNASGDGSCEAMAGDVAGRDWPGELAVRVLQSGKNGGFGAGNNFGIRAGFALCPDAEFVYVLNPDAEVASDAIRALVAHLDSHPEAGIAGSYISGEDGEDHCSAFRFPTLASEFEGAARTGPITRLLRDRVLPMHVPEASGPVGWIVGASMLIRRETLEKIGLFDEAFFLYFDETDLCKRALDAGIETHFVRNSRVVHIGSVSTGMKTWSRMPRYWFESRWYYFCKHHGRAYALTATGCNLLGQAVHRIRRLLDRRPSGGARNMARDMLRHDLGALSKPLPNSREVAIAGGFDETMQPRVE